MTVTIKPKPTVSVKSPAESSILGIHKKALAPAWGKIVQYRKYETKAFSEKSREDLYEFVLQDENGVVRIATYHENANSSSGYWELLIWDQP